MYFFFFNYLYFCVGSICEICNDSSKILRHWLLSICWLIEQTTSDSKTKHQMPAKNNNGNVMRWLEFLASWQKCTVTVQIIWDYHQTELGKLEFFLEKVRRRLGLEDQIEWARAEDTSVLSLSYENPFQYSFERWTMSPNHHWVADSV